MAPGLLKMPSEICLESLSSFFGAAQPIGRLATTSRSLAADLHDSAGCLRVGAIVTGELSSAIEGARCASLHELEVFRFDLSTTCKLTQAEIDTAVRKISDSLTKASALQVLSVRLPSFDADGDRLRLGQGAWKALIRCLGGLAAHERLRYLELSAISIKTSWATQDVSMEEEVPAQGKRLRRAGSEPGAGAGAAAAAGTSLSFFDALAGLSALEELVLTHDEIFGDTAEMLPPAFLEMKQLKRVDLTRNYITPRSMQVLCEATSPKVQLCGKQQTHCY